MSYIVSGESLLRKAASTILLTIPLTRRTSRITAASISGAIFDAQSPKSLSGGKVTGEDVVLPRSEKRGLCPVRAIGASLLGSRWTGPKIVEDRAEYLIVGEEVCPSTGKVHYQGYVEFPNPIGLGGLKKLFDKATL